MVSRRYAYADDLALLYSSDDWKDLKGVLSQERESERENLIDFALRTDTIIRLIMHTKKKSLVAKAREHRGTFRLSSRDAP